MTPKLALNFLINSKETTPKDLQPLFDTMKHGKVIYVEAIISNVTTIAELKPYVDAFKNLRNSKHIDYTIWIDDRLEFNDVIAKLALDAKKLSPLVMGVATLAANTNLSQDYVETIPWFYYGTTLENESTMAAPDMSQPDVFDLARWDDARALKHSLANIDHIHAPEGMKRGLKRVLEDHVKIFSRAIPETPAEESPVVSGQDSE